MGPIFRKSLREFRSLRRKPRMCQGLRHRGGAETAFFATFASGCIAIELHLARCERKWLEGRLRRRPFRGERSQRRGDISEQTTPLAQRAGSQIGVKYGVASTDLIATRSARRYADALGRFTYIPPGLSGAGLRVSLLPSLGCCRRPTAIRLESI